MGHDHRARIGRRAFLGGTAAAVATWRLGGMRIAGAAPIHLPAAAILDPAGTTLASTIVVPAGAGYRALVEGPGQPVVVRSELAAPKDRREDRRSALAAIVQLSDLHLVDAQSPGRVEFLDRYGAPFTGAWRPQEALSNQVASAMVGTLNALARGPVTGRAFDALVSTGDNLDNNQVNELDWFISVLDGGQLTPGSGAAGNYVGVQDGVSPDVSYWHPDAGIDDEWKANLGFPSLDGLLLDAVATYDAEPLDIPWWPTYGNHDGLIQGNVSPSDLFDSILTGDRKITGLPPGMDPFEFIGILFADPQQVADDLAAGVYPFRTMAPDAGRRTVRRPDWIQRLLASPMGTHGYVPSDVDTLTTWYRFEIAPGVVGISLDTCAHGGSAGGNIRESQLRWLEDELASLHEAYLAPDGSVARPGGDDQLVLIFSHHTSGTMMADNPDPEFPDDRRVKGDELVATLLRYPNVVAWVNGHTHTHGITPHPHPFGLTPGFWEVTTASHIDFPEQSRILELVDNADGTLSLFGVVVDHGGPLTTDGTDRSLSGLVSISRTIAANDPQGHSAAFSNPADFNVELVRAASFVRSGVVAPPVSPPEPNEQPPVSIGPDLSEPPLVRTGPNDATAELALTGSALLAAGAALTAAAHFRTRRGAAAPATRGEHESSTPD